MKLRIQSNPQDLVGQGLPNPIAVRLIISSSDETVIFETDVTAPYPVDYTYSNIPVAGWYRVVAQAIAEGGIPVGDPQVADYNVQPDVTRQVPGPLTLS
jgi:hypothetical protein